MTSRGFNRTGHRKSQVLVWGATVVGVGAIIAISQMIALWSSYGFR